MEKKEGQKSRGTILLSPQIDSQDLKLAEKQFLDLVPKQMCRFEFGLFKFANWSLTNSLPPNKMFILCPCHHAPPQYYTVCIYVQNHLVSSRLSREAKLCLSAPNSILNCTYI
jgi:hypothetical protein